MLQMVAGDVDADRQIEAQVVPSLDLAQGLADDPVANLDGQFVAFDGRQELIGGAVPRSGCCQRIRASAPITWPFRMSTLGW
jgi:hypothetical protein